MALRFPVWSGTSGSAREKLSERMPVLTEPPLPSVSHTTDDLVFMWDPNVPLEVDRNIELPQLDLVKKYTGDCTQVYSTGNFTCLEIVFTFKRRLGYYLFHTYVPTCLIVIMSWISFWIRPEAVPARVTLGVTSLLTLSTQHANSQKALPPVSYIKAIDVFMSSCTVFVFFSLMEYALVNVVLGDVPEEHKKTRPRTLVHLPNKQLEAITAITSPLASPANGLSPLEMMAASSCPAHLAPAPHITTTHMVNGPVFHHGMQHATQHSTIQHSVNFGLPPPPPPPPIGNVKANQGHTRRREKAILIDRVSRILFPMSFTVLNVIYWSVFVVKWF
nr:glycine receptor subunit alpha-1-like [Penaeus vannamei]